MSLVKVQNSSFVRDTSSMALINQDKKGLNDYLNKRKIMEAQRNEINTIKSEVNTIKSDVNEIKELLHQLLGKGSNG